MALLVLALLIFVVLGLIAAMGRGPVAALIYGGSGVAALLVTGVAFAFLVQGDSPWRLDVPFGPPGLSVSLVLDGLSAVFLLAVGLAGATASVFGWGYGRDGAHTPGHHGPAPARVLPFFPLFLAGMVMVLLAGDAFGFLFGWEVMSVASWLLVLSTHDEPETQRAARLYLVMAAIGSLCLMVSFGLLAGPEAAFSFTAMREQGVGDGLTALAVVLAVLGAGSKAGLVPLHIWLPLAHPAAPSHVSALMSGVMTKVALYGLCRILFDLAGMPDWWWGALLAALGSLTAVAGVLYALLQDDIKRLLAYSTVENVGFICLSLGLALMFKADGKPVIAALAFSAALLHVLNHSLFKTLLFYGAGAVVAATGTRSLEKLGGLIHRLPRTAPLLLIGSAAASALPPLNGFASEWLGFQAILNGPQLSLWGLKVGVMVVGVFAALAAALAAACFLRFFGIAFLGRPRSAEAVAAQEVSVPLQLAMAVPALLCVLAGILPGLALRLLHDAAAIGVGTALPTSGSLGWLWLAPAGQAGGVAGNSYSGFFVLLVAGGLAFLVFRLIQRHAASGLRRADAWGCGYPPAGPVSQYSGASFAQPLRRVFASGVFQAREQVSMPEPGETGAASHLLRWRDPAWDFVARPVWATVDWLAGRFNQLQFLTIRRYLMLMFATLVTLLAIMAVLS